jgi:hypothetical protein
MWNGLPVVTICRCNSLGPTDLNGRPKLLLLYFSFNFKVMIVIAYCSKLRCFATADNQHPNKCMKYIMRFDRIHFRVFNLL